MRILVSQKSIEISSLFFKSDVFIGNFILYRIFLVKLLCYFIGLNTKIPYVLGLHCSQLLCTQSYSIDTFNLFSVFYKNNIVNVKSFLKILIVVSLFKATKISFK